VDCRCGAKACIPNAGGFLYTCPAFSYQAFVTANDWFDYCSKHSLPSLLASFPYLQMDMQGNLFNFYSDIGGERKITPVGNIKDLKAFKISELAGVKLDRDVNVVAFRDGSTVPLPPGTGYVDERTGQVCAILLDTGQHGF
jgi:hypothetical protein